MILFFLVIVIGLDCFSGSNILYAIRKCSSVLSYYIISKSYVLLISDKLSPEVQVNPKDENVKLKNHSKTIYKGINGLY